MKKIILFLLILPIPIIFLLAWFSLWLYLIIFTGGYIGLFILALAMEKEMGGDRK